MFRQKESRKGLPTLFSGRIKFALLKRSETKTVCDGRTKIVVHKRAHGENTAGLKY
jgi:hypothetical protein